MVRYNYINLSLKDITEVDEDVKTSLSIGHDDTTISDRDTDSIFNSSLSNSRKSSTDSTTSSLGSLCQLLQARRGSYRRHST